MKSIKYLVSNVDKIKFKLRPKYYVKHDYIKYYAADMFRFIMLIELLISHRRSLLLGNSFKCFK